MRTSRKILAAAVIVLSALSMSSIAWSAGSDSQMVSYNVVSFRFLALSLQDGTDCTSPNTSNATSAALTPASSASPSWTGGCAATFPALRRGDIAETSGGNLYYATTLSNDEIEVALDSDMLNGLVLGVYVSGSIVTGSPCVSVGSAATGAPRVLVNNGATVTEGPEGNESAAARSPVVLSSSAANLITGIDNCGATGAPATASIKYVLDAVSVTPEGDQTADENVSAIKKVTYTLKAGGD